MSHRDDRDELREEILENEAHELESEFQEQEELLETQQDTIEEEKREIHKLRDTLARVQADYDNFKKRTQRDQDDMLFFMKADIFKKILPRLDDMERIIQNTPDDQKNTVVYEGVISMHKALVKDLEKVGVSSFEAKGKVFHPDFHEVMTQIPGEADLVLDEFEKGYMLGEKVLRVAKVVVGSGQ